MKIKLPNFRRAPAPPQMTSTGTLTSESIVMGGAGDRMRLWSRRLRGAAGYVALFTVVFFVFVWISLPTRAIAWRIGQEARDRGYIVEIEDLSISPFGGVTLYNVTWTFQSSHSGQIPRKLELPEVAVDVSVLGLLFGNYDVEVDTKIDDATIHAAYTRSDTKSTVQIHVADLPLYDVPKLQQSLNAPLVGLFALDVDLTLPENQFARAEGSISIACASCKVGDGETPLFVPGATGIMSKGVTLPEIDLGSLGGRLVVTEGKAIAEKFETDSDDLTVKITGGMNLADPFSKSEFAFDLRLLIKPVLQDRSEPLKLMVQTAGPSSKLDPPEQDWLGFKLRGSGGKPKFTGIKTKSKEERDREKRQASLERDAKRKAAKAKKEREAAVKKSGTPPTDDQPTTGAPDAPGATGATGATGADAAAMGGRPTDPAGVRPDDTQEARPIDTGREDNAAGVVVGESKPAGERPDDTRPNDNQPDNTRPNTAPEAGDGGGAGQGGDGGAQDGGAAGQSPTAGQPGQDGGAQDGGGAAQGEAGADGSAPVAGELR